MKKMLNPLLKVIKDRKKILLGLSGGPDSTALYHILSTLKGLEIGVAHVDHQWRPTSSQEAEMLKSLVESHGHSFHMKKLEGATPKRNIELAGREARLSFFKEVVSEHGYEAVILAHHANDQAETVLKRLFEGGRPQGMKKVSRWENILLLRPWLQIEKSVILSYLKEKNLPYFEDHTNRETTFLRGKMRSCLIPTLEEQFGKSIVEPLLRHEEEWLLMEELMEKLYGHFIQNPLDCASISDLFARKWVIRNWLKTHEISLSNAAINTLVELTQQNISGKKVLFAAGSILISRKTLKVIRQ